MALMMEMPEDPFSEQETNAALWAALKVTPWGGSFLASPQPDVELPPPYNMNRTADKLTPEMVDKALKDLWRGTIFRGPDTDL